MLRKSISSFLSYEKLVVTVVCMIEHCAERKYRNNVLYLNIVRFKIIAKKKERKGVLFYINAKVFGAIKNIFVQVLYFCSFIPRYLYHSYCFLILFSLPVYM